MALRPTPRRRPKPEASGRAPPRGPIAAAPASSSCTASAPRAGETFLDWSGPIVELLTDWRADQPRRPVRHPAATHRRPRPSRRVRVQCGITAVPRARRSRSTPTSRRRPGSSPRRGGQPTCGHPTSAARSTTSIGGCSPSSPISPRAIDRGRNERLSRSARMATDVIGAGPLPLDWRLVERLDTIQSRTFGRARSAGSSPVARGRRPGRLRPASTDPAPRHPRLRRTADDRQLPRSTGSATCRCCSTSRSRPPTSAPDSRGRSSASSTMAATRSSSSPISGGAFVSFETLLDPAYAHLRVDKLITLGQGLGLAWRLAADPDVQEITPGSRLVGDLAAVRPGPALGRLLGVVRPGPGRTPACPELEGDKTAATAKESSTSATDRRTYPRRPTMACPGPGRPARRTPAGLSARHDHHRVATRHERDERPHRSRRVLGEPRGLPRPAGPPSRRGARGCLGASRFYRDRARPDAAHRVATRTRGARWPPGAGFARSPRSPRPSALIVVQVGRRRPPGDVPATWSWRSGIGSRGTRSISGPSPRSGPSRGARWSSWASAVSPTRLASLGAGPTRPRPAVGLFYALAKVGIGRWHDWDRRERRAMHPETPQLPDRSKAGAQAMLLLGGLLALVFAAFGWAPAAAIAIVLGTAAGLIVWARRPFASDGRPLRPPA